MIETALATAVSIAVLLFWFDIRKIAGFGWLFDILIFVAMMWLFEGTYAGVMTGFIAGLFLTLFFRLIRKALGYKTLRWVRYRNEWFPRLRWISINRHGDAA